MHLVSFVESFHHVHLVPGMRSRRRSPNFFKSRAESEFRTYTLLFNDYVFVAVSYIIFVPLDWTYTTNLNFV